MKRKMKRMLSVMAGAFLLFGSVSNDTRAEEVMPETAVQESTAAGMEETASESVTEGQILDVSEENQDIGEAGVTEAEPDGKTGTDASEAGNGTAEQADTDVGGEEVLFTSGETAEMNLLNAAATTVETDGIPIISAGSVYRTVTSGSDVYKGNYNLLGDRNNKNQFVFTPFNDAGDLAAYYEVGGAKYFVARSTEAAGKYGFLVENVGFNSEQNCKLDMRFTVDGFKDYVFDKSGSVVENIYPAFGFYPENGLMMAFAGPDQNIRIEILKHGTDTPVRGNYSFRWLDIDAGQRFGISLTNGTLTGRYALNTCSAYYQDDFSCLNRVYHMVNAAQDVRYDNNHDNWLDGTVYWEVQNCSQMNLLIASAGNSSQGRYWKNTVLSRYGQYSTGEFSGEITSIIGALDWDGESYGPRENPTQLYKYVSNQEETPENLNGKTSNTVTASGETYYYFLENYVPVEPEAYYYSLYKVTDNLPLGADYDGVAQVVKGENGQDVTEWFDISTQEDTIVFSANHVGQSEFYGSTYIYKIRVKLNAGEITPAGEGNSQVYTVKNTASVTSCHKTESEPKTLTSNEVITTMAELGTGSLRVKKTDTAGKPLSGAVFEIRAKGDILSPSGAVLVPSGTAAASVTAGKDGTALAEGLYAGTYIVAEVKPPEGYCLNAAAQEMTVSGTGEEAAEVVFQNEKTKVYLKKVAELAKGQTERQPVSGVSFLVWNKADGETAGSIYTTDDNGLICLEGLKSGGYCYREESAPEGYVPESTVREFVVDENGLVEKENGHVILVENARIHAEFAKVDQVTGQSVPGASLRLTDETGKEVETWISSDTPHGIDRISPGTYTLTELSAPEGYQKGEPVTCVVGAQAGVQSFVLKNMKCVEITITKTIHAEELVWAHGNPVFTFVIEGTDLNGNAHQRTEVMEFTKDHTADAAGKDVSLNTVVKLPAGTYSVRELSTARYRLEKLSVSDNGTVQGEKALLNLTDNKNGAVEFTNQKITDQYLTETDLVRNQIVP